MKRMFVFGMIFTLLLGCLCGCGKDSASTGATQETQVTLQDVAIEGGLESATKAVEVYFAALSAQNYDDLLKSSASLNKSCVQNTVGNYDEEKYNTGIETMKTELQKDMANVTITATVSAETVYSSGSSEYEAFAAQYKVVCAGIEKAQAYAKVKVTLKYTEGDHEFSEEIEQNCIQIQDKWFVFDYSENTNTTPESDQTEPTEEADVDITIVGGGTSVDDVVAKYFKAISEKNAENMADVLLTMNKTALQAVCGGFDEEQHKKGLEAMKTEMAADPDKATLTPSVTDTKKYETKDAEFATFLSTNANILVRTNQIKAYAVATVSLSISVPGESETFSATETITCVQVDDAWFVIVTE